MQGILLVMCIIFRARQHKLGLDDFGRPLADGPAASSSEAGTTADAAPAPTTPALEAAVGDAVRADVRSEHGVDVVAGEQTPLLPGKQNRARSRSSSSSGSSSSAGKRSLLRRWLRR